MGVVREEWDRKLSFSMTVAEHSTETRAEMLAEVLTALHTLGEQQQSSLDIEGGVGL